MNQVIQDRISKLRSLMADKGIDAYIIPSADNHQSEYVGEFFKAREFMTGFTGSAGTAVITKDKAGLWTDGRYFIQAELQLKGTGIELFKIGNPGVPTILEFLKAEIPENGKLGFDGRLIGLQEGESYIKGLSYKNVSIEYSYDLVDMVWENRPPLSMEPVFMLGEEYTGESRASKLGRIRSAMKEAGANFHVLTTLDDICWLLNIRGNDVMYSPLVLSYAIIGMDKVILFIEESKLSTDIKNALYKDGIELRPYNDIYEYAKNFKAEDAVMIDPVRINYALYKNIPADTKKIEIENPSILLKAMKNSVELANIEKAHIKDGVAFTKFMYWLKTNIGKTKITEISAAEKLDEFRKQQEGYLWQSFEPICAFKDHAAIVHYSATPETNVELEKGHFVLIDTGGNYFQGSTDITRTIALGNVPAELKHHFTTVARCMINLARAKFLYGCTGSNLDILAREPLWEIGMDFNHGTGHGVGYLLNIHEGPAGFRWYAMPGRNESHKLEEGMVITDEPGVYIAGSHGIRIENELVVRKEIENENGLFMHFDSVTLAPIDLDAIAVEDLNRDERLYLNNYHKKVYEKLAPYMTDEEREWLKKYTREI